MWLLFCCVIGVIAMSVSLCICTRSASSCNAKASVHQSVEEVDNARSAVPHTAIDAPVKYASGTTANVTTKRYGFVSEAAMSQSVVAATRRRIHHRSLFLAIRSSRSVTSYSRLAT